MATTWHSFDLASRNRGVPVPVTKLGSVGRTIGTATSATLDAKITDGIKAIPGWEAATKPGRTLLVALDGDDERILWGGMALRRTSTAGTTAQITLATLEHYFTRRYLGDLTFTGTDQASICAGMVGSIATEGIGFTIDAPASTQVRDRAYLDVDDKTVSSGLTELSGVINGPDWTVDLEWVDADHTQLRFVYRVRDRLGTSSDRPARFTLPGCVTDFQLIEDYTDGYGANDCVTTSNGAGSVNQDGSPAPKPYSIHQRNTNLLALMPRFESRRTPSTSIVDVNTLNAAAAADLQAMQNGLSQLSIDANLDKAPKVGIDWYLGDDIAVELTCPRFPAYVDANNELRPGFAATTRATGWNADLDERKLTPTILGALNVA